MLPKNDTPLWFEHAGIVYFGYSRGQSFIDIFNDRVFSRSEVTSWGYVKGFSFNEHMELVRR